MRYLSVFQRDFYCSRHCHAIIEAVTLQSAFAAESDHRSEQSLVVTADTSDDSTPDPARAYTVPATRAGTKLNLTQRDIPQSVSGLTRQRIKDQTLHFGVTE